jgi:hypothetical protein
MGIELGMNKEDVHFFRDTKEVISCSRKTNGILRGKNDPG